MSDFSEIEKQRLLHALWPHEYDNPDGDNCELSRTDDGHTICVAGADHTIPDDHQ